LAAPIFTGGAIAGQVKSAEAVQQQALITYQQAIQAAFREVDDALVDQKRTREQLDALVQQVGSLRQYANLAWLRYENGYTSYLEVLDAESRLYNAELVYTNAQGTLFQSLVNLYKAMGGGWITEADRMTVQTTNVKTSDRDSLSMQDKEEMGAVSPSSLPLSYLHHCVNDKIKSIHQQLVFSTKWEHICALLNGF
jgi:multidrug efflux system outer membrane protein